MIRNVGIRYLANAKNDWEGMSCVIDQLYSRLEREYDKEFVASFLSNIIIDVVPADGARRTPTTTVAESNRTSGSLAGEKKWPWSKTVNVIVVLQRPIFKNASQSSIAHEIIEHLLPMTLGQGSNNNHERQDLKKLAEDISHGCH